MATDAVLQVRIDSELKKDAEELYRRLGISIADAVRMFVVQSLEAQGLPFEVRTGFLRQRTLNAYGIASKYADPQKVPLEKSAWATAAVSKNETAGC